MNFPPHSLLDSALGSGLNTRLSRIPNSLSSFRRSPKPSLLLLFSVFCISSFAARLQSQEPTPLSPTQTALTSNQAPAASAPTAQTPAVEQTAAPTPAPAQAPAAAPATAPAPSSVSAQSEAPQPGEITEEQLKQLLVGKQLFLRGGYLGDSLSFTEHGDPTGHPTIGSYTLSGVEIEKVHLSKHKVELVGARYALHFLGALPYEDPSKAVDRVKITPKKKILRITIDREQVVKPKKAKEPKEPKEKNKKTAKAGEASGELPKDSVTSSETDVSQPSQTAQAAASAPTPAPAPTTDQAQQPASDQAAEQASDQASDQAADQASVTTTISAAHAAKVLRDALDRIFATGLDDKVMAQMPQFWQLYYKAQTAGVDYRPSDPKVLRSSAVDQQAKVLSSIAPDSNEFAQASGIAGRALYRAVIGSDGKPGEIAVVRPIGFGLDENAVAAIRKATFEPALKNGQPVAETLDLAVLFRIYSKRTSVAATGPKSTDPIKPGPYTVREP